MPTFLRYNFFHGFPCTIVFRHPEHTNSQFAKSFTESKCWNISSNISLWSILLAMSCPSRFKSRPSLLQNRPTDGSTEIISESTNATKTQSLVLNSIFLQININTVHEIQLSTVHGRKLQAMRSSRAMRKISAMTMKAVV
jgi:hypothetical protein